MIDTRQTAIDLCKSFSDMGPVPVPPIPSSLQRYTRRELLDMDRRYAEGKCGPGEDETVEEFRDYHPIRDGAIEENKSRLRGLLWCLRELRRAVTKNPKDTEAITFGQLLRAYLAEEWRVKNPPEDLPGATSLADERGMG